MTRLADEREFLDNLTAIKFDLRSRPGSDEFDASLLCFRLDRVSPSSISLSSKTAPSALRVTPDEENANVGSKRNGTLQLGTKKL